MLWKWFFEALAYNLQRTFLIWNKTLKVDTYCMSKKFFPLLHIKLLYKLGQDFLDIQYEIRDKKVHIQSYNGTKLSNSEQNFTGLHIYIEIRNITKVHNWNSGNSEQRIMLFGQGEGRATPYASGPRKGRLTLYGSSKHVAHSWRKKIKFATTLARNKCLDQIKLPMPLHMCANSSELYHPIQVPCPKWVLTRSKKVYENKFTINGINECHSILATDK